MKGIKDAQRIVVKVGTSTLTYDTGKVNLRRMDKLAQVISDLRNSGIEVALVTSAAIAVGVGKLGLPARPKDIPSRQAVATVGQCELMFMYDKLFSEYGNTIGQLLITRSDFESDERRANLSNSFEKLFEFGAIPVINENDSIAVEEIVFGDNDTLSAMVAKLVNADALIILSDIDGLYSGNPREDENAYLIPVVEEISDELMAIADTKGSTRGTGGMVTKLHAAQIATEAGIDTVDERRSARGYLQTARRQTDRNLFQGESLTEGAHIMGAGTVLSIAKGAKEAQRELARAGGAKREAALREISSALRENVQSILEANRADIAAARENGMAESMLDRLTLTAERIEGMAKGVDDVAAMPDPVGRVLSGSTRPNGLRIEKVTVPLGVIGIIYEARPNVTSDAAALCLKAGNAVILRGGKEAINSNKAVANLMRAAVEKAGLPADTVNLIEDTSRESANELMKMNGLVDVLIPRGGAGLIKSVVENSTVPVIETGSGNCHIYIDEFADIDMAANIVFNAKTSRPSVCNACESVLVHKAVAEEAIVAVVGRLKEKNVEIFGDEIVCSVLDFAKPATEEDWGKEYLDYKISIKTVDNIDEAIAHIAKYSTGHSESIITENYLNAQKFLNEVDSAAVYVNASTRFTDGGEFGFGAEIGISTQKLHARGPLGLNNLTSEKYVVYGSGQIR